MRQWSKRIIAVAAMLFWIACAPGAFAQSNAANGTDTRSFLELDRKITPTLAGFSNLSLGLRDISDMNNANIRLGVLAGDSTEFVCAESFPNAQLVYVNESTDRMLMLESGHIDGFLMYDAELNALIEQYPAFAALPEPVRESPCANFAAKNAHGEKLIAQFNALFEKMKRSGEYARIYDKWSSEDEDAKSMPDCTYTGENGTLNIVCGRGVYPFSYERDGAIVGICAEMMQRFCLEYGYAPLFYDASVPAAIAGITLGKYDFCALETIISAERAEVVRFSTPILSIFDYMVVRRDAVAPDVLAEIDAARAADTQITSESESAPVSFADSLALSFEKNFIRENRWKMLLDGLIVTIRLSALSAAFGTILGAFVCFLRLRKNRFLRTVATVYVKIFQGTPIVVLLLVLYYVIFGSTDITAFAVCVLGFSLDFSAYAAEMMRSGIESVPPGQKKAALALGYGQSHAFAEIVLPQAIRHILPVYRGQLVTLVKTTSVAGYISVEDLTKVSDIIRSRTYEAFFPLISTALVYFLLANLLAGALRLIQFRTDPSNRKRLPKGAQ